MNIFNSNRNSRNEDSEMTLLERFSSSTKAKVIAILAWVWMVVTPIWILSSVHRVKADAWEELVLVDKPYFFWKWWVRPASIKTWAEWIWKSTDTVKVWVRPVQYEVKFDDIMTSDNVPVDFSAFVKIKVLDNKTPTLIWKYWTEWYKTNLEQIFVTELRDAIARHPMTSLTTRQDLLSGIQKQVIDEVKKFVTTNQIPVEIQEVIIWKINPPDKIKDQLAETAAQQQRKKTEIEKTWAEIERKNSETKRAEADNAYRNALGLSPEQFIQLENLKAQKEIAKTLSEAKWDVTIILESWSSVQPMMNVGKK